MRAAILSILALIAFAPVAVADGAVEDWRLEKTDEVVSGTAIDSLRIAGKYWRQAAPCGDVRVYRDAALDEHNAMGAAEPASCSLWISFDLTPARTRADRVRVCTTITHEYGHLLFGLEHLSEPRSVLRGAGYSLPRNPRLCALRYGGRRWRKFGPFSHEPVGISP